MSDFEFLRELRKRVDAIIAPHVEIYGQDAPVVRMALRVLAEAERIDAELRVRTVTTEEAAEFTGWHPETLQHYARLRLNGSENLKRWSQLEVEDTGAGYLYVVDTIPQQPRHRRVGVPRRRR